MTGQDHPDGRAGRGAAARRPARRLTVIAAIVGPVAAYVLLRRAFHSDAYALATTETVPAAWVLVDGWRRRRLNPIVLAVAIVLAIALVLTVASSGSTLPLKLRRAGITGPLGVACLVSVLIGRPVLPGLLELLEHSAAGRGRAWVVGLRRLLPEERAGGLTLIVGLTLLADAATQITLALAVSTTVFVAVAGLARLALAVAGLAACTLYVRAGRGADAENGQTTVATRSS